MNDRLHRFGQRVAKYTIRFQLFWLLVTLVVGLTGGVVLDRAIMGRMAQENASRTASLDVPLITQAWNIIEQDYVDRAAVQPRTLTYGAIGGMTDALGDTGHSRFLTPDMVKQESNFDQGQFEGIGAEIGTQDSHIVIVSTFENSPAQRAGLHAGDILLKVDGMDVTGLTPSEVVTHVLGPAGTYVTLTIADPSKGSVAQDVTIVRAKIALENLTWQQLPGTTIAHVKLAAFSNGVTEELKKDLNDIKAQHLTGIVLDLRNDPGGLLDEAIGVTSQFLSSGNVLEEKDSRGQVVKVGVKSGGEAPDIPLVVLVDNGTASAAEIVGGALQDAHRAKLYGEITFGTGTVLNQYGLADGSALLLATEEWLTPNGRVIWHKGIAPDVQVALPAGVSPLDPLGERSMTSAQLQASGDAQLLQALDSLIQSAHKP